MKYETLDEKAAADGAKETLAVEALKLDEIAYMKELSRLEQDALHKRGVGGGFDPTTDRRLRDEAQAAREEADLYIKASEVNPERIKSNRFQLISRWQEQIERQHVSTSALRKVKVDAGLPVPDHDSNLETLEAGHAIALSEKKKYAVQPDAPADDDKPVRRSGRVARK